MTIRSDNGDYRSEFRAFIKVSEVTDAYDRLVDAVCHSTKFECEFGNKGNLRHCLFHDGSGTPPYAFATNQKSLKFWFRSRAIKSGVHSKEKLARDFGGQFDDNPNSGNEWTLRILSTSDVDTLLTNHLNL